MAILRLCAALAALVLTGCQLVHDPTPFEEIESRVTVHAVLVAGEREARVLLTIAPANMNPYLPGVGLEPVAGASPRLVAGKDTTLLVSTPDAPANPCFGNEPALPDTRAAILASGCYHAALTVPISEGSEYQLLIALPDGATVRGRTVVPAAPQIVQPASGGTMSATAGETTAVAWRGAGALRTELAVRPADDRCTVYVSGSGPSFGGSWSLDVTGRSTADVRSWPQCPGLPAGPVSAELVISVFDTAYTRFAVRLLRGQNVSLKEARAGIEGPAIGYFAGAARALQSVVVKAPLTASAHGS